MRVFISILRMTMFLLILAVLPLKGQPLSPTQWYRINTPHADLIFRGGMSWEAQRMANTITHLYGPVSQSLRVKPASIPLILLDQKFEANGGFKLPPRRIEFWNGPPQDYNLLGTNDWFNMLAIHEFRHAVQHAKLKQNFNQWLSWLGGDLAISAITGLLVPPWFFEGDAVSIETALTNSGRGRIPYFSVLYKANLLERGGFSYSKQVFQSFKHQIPNHYRVGYYLTTHLRRKYGVDVLSDIMEKMTWPLLFPIAVKKVTGKNLLQIYEDTNEELKDLWQKQLEGLKLTPVTSMMTRQDETYTDYRYPQLDENGNVIVLKSGLGTAAQFVVFDKQGQEQPLFIPGHIHERVSFSAAQGQIVWTEFAKHPRWKDHRYGIIQRYDIRKKQLKTLTHRSKYGTAALSPDASKIVAVESDTSYHHRLVILDAVDGKVLHRIPNPENYFYLTPRWLANGRLVVAVKHHQQKATLTLIDILTGEEQDLIPYSEENIGVPVPHGKYVFYNSAYSGIDNIYALDLVSRQRYQVTSRQYGAYNATVSADGHWIIFNDFTKDGMDVVKMPLSPEAWIPQEEIEDRSIRYYAPLVKQENNGDVLEHVPSRTYPVTPYHPEKHLLNIHSWTWPIPPPKSQNDGGKPGFILHSNNLLQTTEFKTGYLYNIREHAGETFAKLTYKGWYPVITLEGSLKEDYKQQATIKEAALTFSLPLEFTQGQYTNKFSLSTTSSLGNADQVSWFAQTYKGQISREAKTSPRDLASPWKQQLSASYKHTPYRKEQEIDTHQQTLTVQSEFMFPGLFRHHSLELVPQYRYQSRARKEDIDKSGLLFFLDRDGAWWTMPINTPKQLLLRSTEKTYQITARYKWPVAYPDWTIGDLLYVKRIIAHLFYVPQYLPTEVIKYEYEAGLKVEMDLGFSFLSAPLRVGWAVVYDRKKGFRYEPTFNYRLGASE